MLKSKLIPTGVLFLIVIFATPINAYDLNIDIDQSGHLSYYIPTVVLGDQDKSEVKHEEEKSESHSEKKAEIPEVKKPETTTDKPEPKEVSRIDKPEKIEIKKENSDTKVTIKKPDKTEKTLSPKNVGIKMSAVPKVTPSPITESEVDHESSEVKKVTQERQSRDSEKIEIQSEVHDDGSVELQLESRDVKAKIKSDEIEVNVKNNSIGMTNEQGGVTEINHLPDQVQQKFLDLGISSTPGTLEIGKSGEDIVYKARTTTTKNLFGIIPREVESDIELNDATGEVSQQEVNQNIIDKILNFFSF